MPSVPVLRRSRRRPRTPSDEDEQCSSDSSGSTVAAPFNGCPSDSARRHRKIRRTSMDNMRSLSTAIEAIDRFDVDAVERLFFLASSGKQVIEGIDLQQLAVNLGWPSHGQADFLYLVFAVYTTTSAHSRSCLKLVKEGWIAAFAECRTSSMKGVARYVSHILEEAYGCGAYLYVDFHRFVFTFLLVAARGFSDRCFARTVLAADAKPALIATMQRLSKFVSPFVAYLDYAGIRVINMDQWMTFHSFTRVVQFPSLDGYVFDDCWPCLLDDFVDWSRQNDAFKYLVPARNPMESEGGCSVDENVASLQCCLEED